MVERCSHLSPSHRDEAITRIEAARVAAPSSVDAKSLTRGESALAVASVNG
jgi:hypothetical protein